MPRSLRLEVSMALDNKGKLLIHGAAALILYLLWKRKKCPECEEPPLMGGESDGNAEGL